MSNLDDFLNSMGNRPSNVATFNLADPESVTQIAKTLIELDDDQANGLYRALLTAAQIIVAGIALSNSPEHVESDCPSSFQHYPWTLLEAMAENMQENEARLSEDDTFDSMRVDFHEILAHEQLSREIEQMPEDFSPEDIIEGGEKDD